MRYYEITITSLSGKKLIYKTAGSAGNSNGSALRVDLDIYQLQYNQVGLNSYVRIYGISYEDIKENLNPDLANQKFATIEISAGMAKGLPFAKPDQQGILVTGLISQAFANWQGTEIALDLYIVSAQGTFNSPVNIPWNWKKGKTLESAVKTALGIAYPGIPVEGKYSDTLVYTEDQTGIYYDLEQFSTYVYDTSRSINSSPNYVGAQISYTPDGFILEDGSQKSTSVKDILYTDMIGNLTWLEPDVIQGKLVMRGDLAINQVIKFPKASPITNVVNNFSQNRNNVSQQGEWQINKIHHLGSSRQASADNWVTIVNCIPPTKGNK